MFFQVCQQNRLYFFQLIQERTGINTVTAENPASVVALGTGQYREVMNEFESQF